MLEEHNYVIYIYNMKSIKSICQDILNVVAITWMKKIHLKEA